VAQVVVCRPSKFNTLSSNRCTTKKKKKIIIIIEKKVTRAFHTLEAVVNYLIGRSK
jgi:hypothetical protein